MCIEKVFDMTSVTEDIPAGDYTLEINVTAADTVSKGNPVTVTVSNANGDSTTVDIIETGLTEINFDHSTAGNITVEYAGSNKNSRIEINYQRLVIR